MKVVWVRATLRKEQKPVQMCPHSPCSTLSVSPSSNQKKVCLRVKVVGILKNLLKFYEDGSMKNT